MIKYILVSSLFFISSFVVGGNLAEDFAQSNRVVADKEYSIRDEPICNAKGSECEMFVTHINSNFTPNKKNNYGRYRSLLSMHENNMIHEGHSLPTHRDFSAAAFAEGILWESLEPIDKMEAMLIERSGSFDWIVSRLNDDDVKLVKQEVIVFNNLSEAQKSLWMTLSTKSRREAINLKGSSLKNYIRKHAHEISFNPTDMSMWDIKRNLSILN